MFNQRNDLMENGWVNACDMIDAHVVDYLYQHFQYEVDAEAALEMLNRIADYVFYYWNSR